MSTLALTREHALADLIQASGMAISLDCVRGARTGTHLRSEFRRAYDSIVRGLEDGGFTRESMPEYAAYAIDQVLLGSRGTSPRSYNLTSSQLLFRASERLEEAITRLRAEP